MVPEEIRNNNEDFDSRFDLEGESRGLANGYQPLNETFPTYMDLILWPIPREGKLILFIRPINKTSAGSPDAGEADQQLPINSAIYSVFEFFSGRVLPK